MEIKTHNMLVSYFSGFLFSLAWWFLIDANVMSNKWKLNDGEVTGIHYLSAIGSSIGLIIISLAPRDILVDFNEVINNNV
jgi:hypothetical protein